MWKKSWSSWANNLILNDEIEKQNQFQKEKKNKKWKPEETQVTLSTHMTYGNVDIFSHKKLRRKREGVNIQCLFSEPVLECSRSCVSKCFPLRNTLK